MKPYIRWSVRAAAFAIPISLGVLAAWTAAALALAAYLVRRRDA